MLHDDGKKKKALRTLREIAFVNEAGDDVRILEVASRVRGVVM